MCRIRCRISPFKAPNKAYTNNFNAAILIESVTVNNFVSTAAEAKTTARFYNCTTAIAICNALIGLGHTQNKTSIKTDNSTASSFVHSEMCLKYSESWYMKYNCLRDCVAQIQFNIRWDKGAYNPADYFTKHHPLVTLQIVALLMSQKDFR